MKFNRKKIAFFDRDGVLNVSSIKGGYIGLKKDFRWVPGAKRGLKYIQNLDCFLSDPILFQVVVCEKGNDTKIQSSFL